MNILKHLTFSLILLFSITLAIGQEETAPQIPVNAEGKIMYRDVVNEDGPADSLYLRSISWLNSEFSNPWDVSRVRDREDAKLSGIARMPLSVVNEDGIKVDAGLVEYTFTIESKDGRYRYTFTDFLHKRRSRFPVERWLDKEDPLYQPVAELYLKQIDTYILKQIERLKEGMKPKEQVVDEW